MKEGEVMKELRLQKEQVLQLENNKGVKLEYYLTIEDSADEEWGSIYGIQVIKKDGDFVEEEATGGITYSKELALEILNKLFLFQVTPISVIEIVDELLTQVLNNSQNE